MAKKLLVLLVLSLVAASFVAHAQVGQYPLIQYSVGQQYHHSKSNLKFAGQPQADTLTIPFIEDFSGAMVPIKKIIVDSTITSVDSVYQIQHLKMHGLDPSISNPIFIFNVSFRYATTVLDKADTIKVYGKRYAKVIDKYTIEIYNDTLCTIPTPTFDINRRMFYCNWLRFPLPRYSTYPDTLAFLDNDGGVFINDDMATNAPSVGVASFDGVNYNGIPYSIEDVNGYADNLTSLPFYLDTFQKKDSLGMSFYWQSHSHGNDPLNNEFLTLEFKDSTNKWHQVFKVFGNPSETQDTFRLAFVPIDSMYLYDGFQYRFRNYGVLDGRFNVWNVDYIYINTKMKLATAATKDVSYSSISKNCLKNYTSIPYQHFKNLSAPSDQLNANASFLIKANALIVRSTVFHMATTDNRLDTIANSSIAMSPKPGPASFSLSLPTTCERDSMIKPYILRQNFYYTNNDTVVPIDMSFNNFRKNETYLYDYYAYDDGTPESTVKCQERGGLRMVNQYTILQKDTLTHLDYGFIKNNGPDMSNLNIFMTVLRSDFSEIVKNGQKISIQYSPDINGFVRYEFAPHIVLDSGTYYFGFRQQFDEPLFLGYDHNNDQLNKIYMSTDGVDWTPFSDVALNTGAIMIRPVFSKGDTIVTSIKKAGLTEQKEHFTLYPNPTANIVQYTGAPDYATIYDISGRIVFQNTLEVGKNSIEIGNLTNGIYVVALKKSDYTEIKRLVVQK